ncbi:MAG: hypothetical protein AAFX93_00745 [Verrucomicrobiota bacterium]
MKKYLLAGLASLAFVYAAQAQSPTPVNNNPPTINFDKTKDLYIAQFDSKPDPDDIQAIAAVGSMLAHPDLHGVDFYGVQGTVGMQGYNCNVCENNNFIPAPALMDLAFGPGRWSQAGMGNRNTFPQNSNFPASGSANWGQNTNWIPAVNAVVAKAKTALDRGGNVYVADAGNMDFTRDWVQSLINTTGYTANDTRNRIIVVQHSNWNENNTTTTPKRGISGGGSVPAGQATVLEWVRNNTDYRRIADGNGNNATPGYNSSANNWQTSAEANSNPNTHARNLWLEADSVLAAHGFFPSYSNISNGGVDFSDTAETWYIFNVGTNANTIQKFWNRYVTNTNSANGPVPGPVGGNPGNDSIDCSQLPSSVASAASFDVQIPYSAAGPRDVTVEWYGNGVWGGTFRTTVGSGSGTATVTITPNGGAPAVGTAGELRPSLRAVGAGWQNPFATCATVNVSVTGGGTGPTNNGLVCSSLPATITNATSINVALDYEATASRDIYLEVRRVSDNGWVTSNTVTVPAGTLTATIPLNIGTQPDGTYKFTAGMYNVGENWSNGTAYDNCSQIQFSLTSGGTGPTNNALVCSSLPSTVANASTVNIALDYEATASRDIYLEIRRVSDNGWIGANTVTVPAGTSTATIPLNIGTQPAGTYKFTAGLYNVGENWTNGPAYDNCSQVQFTLGSGGSSGGTVTENPTQDAYIQGSTPFNDTNLKVEPNFRVSYLKFDVNGVSGTVTGAKLVFQNTESGSGTVRVYQGNSNPGWTEASITAGNAPSQGAQLGSVTGSYANGGSLEIDLGTSIGNGEITFVVTMDGGGNDVWFSSSEGATNPVLEITYQ